MFRFDQLTVVLLLSSILVSQQYYNILVFSCICKCSFLLAYKLQQQKIIFRSHFLRTESSHA